MTDYIVYEVYYHDELVYLGSGKRGREKHPLSGKSSCVELNKIFFTEPDSLRVVVIREGLTKQESLESEKDFIMVSSPRFNKQLNSNNSKIKKFRKYTL